MPTLGTLRYGPILYCVLTTHTFGVESQFNVLNKAVERLGKGHMFWEGHKYLRNLHLTFVLCYMWRFRKILWPSQNIWTLICGKFNNPSKGEKYVEILQYFSEFITSILFNNAYSWPTVLSGFFWISRQELLRRAGHWKVIQKKPFKVSTD